MEVFCWGDLPQDLHCFGVYVRSTPHVLREPCTVVYTFAIRVVPVKKVFHSVNISLVWRPLRVDRGGSFCSVAWSRIFLNNEPMSIRGSIDCSSHEEVPYVIVLACRRRQQSYSSTV